MESPAPPDRIAGWWRRWPDANVGIVTGIVSGLAVVDVDPRNGGDVSLRDLERQHGLLPVTSEAVTGGGGRHLFFHIDRTQASAVLGPGLELKADGGMVVAPPSRHASGRRYRWRPGGTPDDLVPAPLPERIAAIDDAVSPVDDTRPPDAPVRTDTERAAFAASWARAGVDLEPGDRYYHCPFHDDHHPSLHIDADGCRWYCFGCRVGGGTGRLLHLLGEHAVVRPRSRLRRRIPDAEVALPGTREVEVVGESHHQDELLEIAGGQRRYGGVDIETVAELVPTPENPYDPEAIEVRVERRVVGHIGRHDLGWLRPIVEHAVDLRGTATCGARILGGWDRGRGDVGAFGVVLVVPDTDR
jgi:hypothetical protein